MKEKWKEHPKYKCTVSDQGKVIGIYTKTLKPYINSDGYAYITVYLRNGEGRKTVYIHRLVLETFVGPAPKDHEADHKNKKRKDNHLENLRWLPIKENRMGWLGKRSSNAKLKDNQVLLIRKRLKLKAKQTDLANKFGVCRQTIAQIASGKSFKDLLRD